MESLVHDAIAVGAYVHVGYIVLATFSHSPLLVAHVRCEGKQGKAGSSTAVEAVLQMVAGSEDLSAAEAMLQHAKGATAKLGS